jgi:predicted DNA-binding transcriptional regulator AlpA
MGPKLSATENDRYIPARAVWERYGVTHMTLYRWLDSEEMNFPRPRYIGRYRYWRVDDLRAWEAGRPSVGAPIRASRRRQEATTGA